MAKRVLQCDEWKTNQMNDPTALDAYNDKPLTTQLLSSDGERARYGPRKASTLYRVG